ncbi:MAG: TRAM domain-containing protein, partial [Coriobacteriia bacterium]|nr:TRAM domain-containing protein [Coriobacteriia bacterium]
IEVTKEGKERGQGVGYLGDGTMVVIADGVGWIGAEIEVRVTTVLQTAGGRMIFAKPVTSE